MPSTSRSRFAVAVAAAALLLMVAGCGSSSKSTSAGSATSSTAQSTTASTAPAKGTVNVATTSLGKTLVDEKGMTIYVFTKDTGETSACTGPCAAAWPPVPASGTPTAGSGVTATLSASSASPAQLLVNGHPVYTYAADAAPGDVKGQGVGGIWYALDPAGQMIKSS